MSNGSNLPHTWTQFIDLLDADPLVRDTLRDAAKAKEIGPRAPAVIYLQAMKDAGDAYFEILPEPWSDQETKKHGDNTDVDADTVAVWNGNPRRYWDNYSYEVQGQKVTGSVYLDMVDRTADGKAYIEFAKACSDWNKDGEKTGLPPIAEFNGTMYDLENMTPQRRKDLKAMADSRRYTARDNLRVVVQIWRNRKDIDELFKGVASIDFIFEREPDEHGNPILERVKKPIEVHGLITEEMGKVSAARAALVGQRSGQNFTCTSAQFANLAPRKCAAMENGLTFENLKRVKRKVAKVGAQPSTQETEKQALAEARVTSNNFGLVLEKCSVFTEEDEARASWINRLVHMEKEPMELQIAAAVSLYDFLTPCITPDWRAVHRRITATQADRKADALAAKLKAGNEIAEAEAQPTQNERNEAAREAMRVAEGEDVDAAKQRAEDTHKPSKKPAAVGGKKRAAV